MKHGNMQEKSQTGEQRRQRERVAENLALALSIVLLAGIFGMLAKSTPASVEPADSRAAAVSTAEGGHPAAALLLPESGDTPAGPEDTDCPDTKPADTPAVVTALPEKPALANPEKTEPDETGSTAGAAAPDSAAAPAPALSADSSEPADETGQAVRTAASAPAGSGSGRITGIGDSVMLSAADALAERLPGCIIDGSISRQVSAGADVARRLESEGLLGDTVVIGLGINGVFQTSTGQALLDVLGPERDIRWVTAYGATIEWQEDVNATIRKLADSNENVRLIDWAAVAGNHPEWFYNDGVHLTPVGRTAYADVVAQALTG